MRFLIDRCAGRRIADRLKALGHDVAEARERTPDPGDDALLAWAAAEQRVLVTMDKDFGELIYREVQPTGASSACPMYRQFSASR